MRVHLRVSAGDEAFEEKCNPSSIPLPGTSQLWLQQLRSHGSILISNLFFNNLVIKHSVRVSYHADLLLHS